MIKEKGRDYMLEPFWKIRTCLPEPFRQIRTFLPELFLQIRAYFPEPVLANKILFARTVLTNKSMSVHQCPLVVGYVCYMIACNALQRQRQDSKTEIKGI